MRGPWSMSSKISYSGGSPNAPHTTEFAPKRRWAFLTKLRNRVDWDLPVARGRADMLSMHTATLALIEALLVGIAADRPGETIANLESLNRLRSGLAGKAMNLPAL